MIVQIIATIGPATGNKKILQEMIKNGMSLARLNFSWGTLEEHDFYIQLIRKVARELKKKIPIIQDLSGPRIAKNDKHSFDSGDKSILTRKDLLDLDFGVKHDVDYVAQSVVGDASDVTRLRSEMKVRNFNKPIIAKIERKRALSNLEEIIKASDAIMIGRGDLGNEIPLEQIPYAQETIIKRVKQAGKPVIVATELMLSMTNSPTPTRADVSDTTWAVLQGTDAIMLSEESAIGTYPLEAVKMMKKIIDEAEIHSLLTKNNSL